MKLDPEKKYIKIWDRKQDKVHDVELKAIKNNPEILESPRFFVDNTFHKEWIRLQDQIVEFARNVKHILKP